MISSINLTEITSSGNNIKVEGADNVFRASIHCPDIDLEVLSFNWRGGEWRFCSEVNTQTPSSLVKIEALSRAKLELVDFLKSWTIQDLV